VAVLKTDVAVLKTDVAVLKGSDLERRVRENPARYLVDHLEHPARIRALTGEALESFFETLSRKSPLEPDELRRLRRTDLLAEARVQGAATRLTIVAEVSATLHVGDVVRAAESAGAVSRRGLPTARQTSRIHGHGYPSISPVTSVGRPPDAWRSDGGSRHRARYGERVTAGCEHVASDQDQPPPRMGAPGIPL
jgi:hypothetical protein